MAKKKVKKVEKVKRTFKVKKKVSGGGPLSYRKWAEWEEGDILIGKYKGSRIDRYKKENFMVEVIDAQFEDEDFAESIIGKTFSLNSAGSLNKAMEEVEEGEIIQVTYNGMGEIKKGTHKGKDAHSVELDILEEEGEESDDDDEEEEEEEEYEDNDDDEEDEDDL